MRLTRRKWFPLAAGSAVAVEAREKKLPKISVTPLIEFVVPPKQCLSYNGTLFGFPDIGIYNSSGKAKRFTIYMEDAK